MAERPSRSREDAFGHALLAWSAGADDPEVYEREDGYIEVGPGPEVYLGGIDSWPLCEQLAIGHARGQVLDVGCGAGRVSLHLHRRRGIDVTSIDSSALAIRACRMRNVKHARRGSVASVESMMAGLDTVVLFGNNFGIFGSPSALRATLTRWAKKARPGTCILAGSTSPASGGVPALDAGYRAANRQSGLMPGQLRMRIRFRAYATPYFRWLFTSPAEMRRLVSGTGWRQAAVLGPADERGFVALLERP